MLNLQEQTVNQNEAEDILFRPNFITFIATINIQWNKKPWSCLFFLTQTLECTFFTVNTYQATFITDILWYNYRNWSLFLNTSTETYIHMDRWKEGMEVEIVIQMCSSLEIDSFIKVYVTWMTNFKIHYLLLQSGSWSFHA